MTDSLDLAEEFHRAFDIPVAPRPTMPDMSDDVRCLLYDVAVRANDMAVELLEEATNDDSGLLMRLHLCMEELSELAEAMGDRDNEGALDALCDMRYVADGAVLHLGFANTFRQAIAEVHRSNMSKLVDGVPVKNEAGRILKPETFSKPDLRAMAGITGLTEAVTVKTRLGNYTYSPDNSDPSKGPWPFKVGSDKIPKEDAPK